MIAFERAGWLALLVLPLLWWWFARASQRIEPRASGIWDWWQARAAAGAQARRRAPAWVCLACGALALALFALSGPHRPIAARQWRVVADARARLDLPVRPGGPTRLEVALADCDAWLRERGESRDEPRSGELAEWDLPGVLWLVARAPDPPPLAAGWFASGGEALSGLVARGAQAGRRVRWWYDGARVRIEDDPEPQRELVLDERAPEPLRALALLWAETRGFAARAQAPQGSSARRLRCADPAVPRRAFSVRAGCDGWTLAPAQVFENAQDDGWLAWNWQAEDGSPCCAVRSRDGVIEVASQDLGVPQGDPAAFATSWSRRFEAAWDTDGVALAARLEQGVRAMGAPARARSDEDRGAGTEWTSALASAAALLALCAALAYPRRPR